MAKLIFFALVALVIYLVLRSTDIFRLVMWDGQVVKQRRAVPGPVRKAIAELAKERKLTGTVELALAVSIKCHGEIDTKDGAGKASARAPTILGGSAGASRRLGPGVHRRKA